MTTLTNAQLLDQFNLVAELEAAALQSVIDFTGHPLQRQGDVLMFKQPALTLATTPVPAEGVVVVKSEARQGNTHILHAYEGECYFDATQGDPFDGERVVYGTLTIPAGSTAVLIHTGEHPALGLTEGTYEVRGQVEGANELRRVAD